MIPKRRAKIPHKKLYLLPVLLVAGIGILALSVQNFNFLKNASGCGCEDPKTANGNFQYGENKAYFMNQEVTPLLAVLPEPEDLAVLGEVSPEDKWIEIDLSEQKLTAWEGNNKYMETLVSSGKTGPTPRGEFRIWGKYKYAKMSGGSKENGTYYYLPNVPYIMYFNGSYGLHGTYWHNNFGHPMSHGCVNLPTSAAEKLFYWSTPSLPSGKNSISASKDNPGTRVVVHE